MLLFLKSKLAINLCTCNHQSPSGDLTITDSVFDKLVKVQQLVQEELQLTTVLCLY
jgi:hypothetical protein